jgi:hypothetical protein
VPSGHRFQEKGKHEIFTVTGKLTLWNSRVVENFPSKKTCTKENHIVVNSSRRKLALAKVTL